MKYASKIILAILVTSFIVYKISIKQTPIQNKPFKLKKSDTKFRLWGYVFKTKYSKGNIFFLEHNLSGERINCKLIKNIEREAGQEIVSDKIAMFKSLFETQRTGYPGQHTKYIECPQEFKPKFLVKNFKDGYLKYFLGFANSNYVSGACSQDLIKYNSIYGFLYCDSKDTMIEIDYFVPLGKENRIKDFISKINCEFN